MPNHVHVLISLYQGVSLWEVTKLWKGASSTKINSIVGRSGTLWQKESFDHYVRDEFYFKKIINYIEENPVKAGLCNSKEQWRFSSAYCGGEFIRR